MASRIMRPTAAAALVAAVLAATAPPAAAHEERTVGELELAVGFGTEPAYAGEVNSVQLILASHDQPVLDLGDTLDVEVSFGDQEPLPLSLEPFFEVGEFGTPGDYRGWFVPTSPGRYTFHFTGTVDGRDVDETFESGPRTFDDVVSPTDVQYPETVPAIGDVAQRVERMEPRLTDAIGEAASAARSAADDASGARALGVIGIGVGALGLLAGAAALLRSRRRAA